MLTFGLEEERKRKISNGDLDGPQPKMKKGEEGYEEEKHGEEEDAAAANDGEEATVEATVEKKKANEEKEERGDEEEEERGEDNRLEHEYANDPAEVMLIECKAERNSSPELDDSTSHSQLSQLSGNSMEIDMNGKILQHFFTAFKIILFIFRFQEPGARTQCHNQQFDRR